jgi:beta-N-acetylhexosaminidase
VIDAHINQGVLCTLKHFPGHGSARADSHLGFVDVSNTWSPLELQPYERIIRAGKCEIVMTAHIFNEKLDVEHPATLSRATIAGILRERLGHGGVIISDDMQMKAIANHYSLERALYLAIDAGVDMFTFSPSRAYQTDLATRAIRAIRGLVQDGSISPERIDESYARIKAVKARLGD